VAARFGLLSGAARRTENGRSFAYGGGYTLRVKAQNALGIVELTRPFSVLRAAPLSKPKRAATSS
jgi:hypothetical protein